MIAAFAALLILSMATVLALDLLFAWSEGLPVRGRHVWGVVALVILLTWRIGTRILTGTM